MQGKRFRYLFSRLGLKPADVAKLLQVSERTIHNWVAGSVRVPYSAYKLLKLQLHYELPGKDWEGWSFSAGKLYTPEGYTLHPHDWSWWSLLARRAASFAPLYRENGLLKVELAALRQAAGGTSASVSSRLPGAAAADVLTVPGADLGQVRCLVTPHFSPTSRTDCPHCQRGKSKQRRGFAGDRGQK